MKKQTSKITNSRDGGALLMVLLTLLFVSILQIGLFKLRETNAVESVFVEDHKQAFWLAESGITDGQLLVQFDAEFRDNPYTVPVVSVPSVGGNYTITVTKEAINPLLQEYEYTITSVGTINNGSVNEVSRKIQKKLLSVPGANNIIIGKDGVTDLAGNIKVKGSIAQIEGDLIIKDSRVLDGYIIMGDGEEALTDTKGEAVVANYPPPTPPSIVYSNYQTAMEKLASNPGYPPQDTMIINDSVLSGTIYYNATNVIVGGTGTTIADNTTIVTTGSISFPKSHVSIGKNVTIVSDNFSIANQADIGAGSVVFSNNDIYIANASDSSVPGVPGVTLLALGDITLASQIDFRGIIFAEGEVNLKANGSIEGTIIGGDGINGSANLTLTYDPSVFSSGTPIDPLTFGGVILTQISWLELPML